MNLKKTEFVKGTDDLHLHCPICNFEYIHLTNVETTEGTDTEKRLAVTLAFDCENGHEFEHHFYNHKGYTLVTKRENAK